MLEPLFAPDVGNHSEVLSLSRPTGSISDTPKRFVTLSIIETGDIQFQKFESGFTSFKFLKLDVTNINICLPYECLTASPLHLINGQCFSSLSKWICIGDNSDRLVLLRYLSSLLMFLLFNSIMLLTQAMSHRRKKLVSSCCFGRTSCSACIS